MNRRRCLNVLAGSIMATMLGLGTRQSFAHGHGGGGGHHSEHEHEHHTTKDHQHNETDHDSHYHHDHDGDHNHDCRDTEEVNKKECQNHNGAWERD